AGITSAAAGKVTKIAVKAGDKISVGGVILSLQESGAAASTAASKGETPKTAAPKAKPAKTKPAPAAEPTEEAEPEAAEEESDWDESVAAKAGFPPPAAPTIRR